jgi:cytochrome subunit of sulfide dehydrogenase
MTATMTPPMTMTCALPTRWRAPLGAALLTAAAVLPAQGQTQDAHLARNLAATCANCHGTNGQARAGEMVSLAGRPAAATVALMGAFKAGQVPAATIMHQIAKGYTDEQIRLIAGYFAAQKAAGQ